MLCDVRFRVLFIISIVIIELMSALAALAKQNNKRGTQLSLI